MRNIRKRHAGNTPGGCRTFAGRTRREAGRNGDDEARKTGSVQYFRDAFPRLVSALFRTQIRRREGHRRATHGGTFEKNATSAPPFSMGRSGISAGTSKVGVRMYGCLKGKVRMFPCRTSALSNPIRRVSPPPFPHFFRHFRARFGLKPHVWGIHSPITSAGMPEKHRTDFGKTRWKRHATLSKFFNIPVLQKRISMRRFPTKFIGVCNIFPWCFPRLFPKETGRLKCFREGAWNIVQTVLSPSPEYRVQHIRSHAKGPRRTTMERTGEGAGKHHTDTCIDTPPHGRNAEHRARKCGRRPAHVTDANCHKRLTEHRKFRRNSKVCSVFRLTMPEIHRKSTIFAVTIFRNVHYEIP